jgi:hypothetical protein
MPQSNANVVMMKIKKGNNFVPKEINRSTTIFFIFCRNLQQVLSKGYFILALDLGTF